MKVRLNLATAPLENNRRFLLSAFVAGGLALALFVVLSMQAVRNWRDSSEFRAEMSKLQRELSDYRTQRRDLEDFFNSPGARRVMDRAAFLNELIHQRSFPWTKIFMNLESSLPTGVRVVSISPRMEKGQVEIKLVVGARNDDDKIRFLRILEESPDFSRVQVVSESRPPQGDDKLLIEVAAWYKSAEADAGAPSPKVAASQPGGTN